MPSDTSSTLFTAASTLEGRDTLAPASAEISVAASASMAASIVVSMVASMEFNDAASALILIDAPWPSCRFAAASASMVAATNSCYTL